VRAWVAVDGRPVVVDVPTPRPGPGEVRLAVRAAGLNRADLHQIEGVYPPPPGATEVLGLEASGVVDAVGPGVTDLAVGDRVAALLVGGGLADRVVVPAGHTLVVPESVGLCDAAALPEALVTVWTSLVHVGGLRPGERLLVRAGASGVGTAAIQLAGMLGCPVFVVVGSTEKLKRCLALGASGGHVRGEPGLREAVRAWGPVDVALDPVGAGAVDDDLAMLAVGGRVVVIGLLGGRRETIDLGRLLVRRLSVIGTVLRSRSNDDKASLVAGVRDTVWPAVADGTIRPVVDTRFAFDDLPAALERLASNETFGKVLVHVAGADTE
jgi:putative PIG3 family NAD(P)H quinone oxidoreductase